MRNQLSTADEKASIAAVEQPLIPPDEQFWKRYSPHHEFPLSGMLSVIFHVLLFVLIVGGSIFLVRANDKGPIEVGERLSIVDDRQGDNALDGEGGSQFEKREAGPSQNANKSTHVPVSREPDLKAPAPTTEKPPEMVNPSRTIIEQAETSNTELAKATAKATEEMRKQILAAPRPPGGRPGDVLGGTPGGRLDDVMARMDRWVLVFETRDGRDYLRQLESLGAILAIPIGENQFMVYHDLRSRPLKGQVEAISKIERIFWIDDKPESVRSLAEALQLDRVPVRFVAFFPRQFEEELLRKELRFQNKKEHEIRKTIFQMQRRGNRYEAVVREQILIR